MQRSAFILAMEINLFLKYEPFCVCYVMRWLQNCHQALILSTYLY